jgi:hypothetical protein
MGLRRWARPLVALGLVGASACGSDSSSQASVPAQADKCVVGLHGKGGGEVPPAQRNGYVQLSPGGNAKGWGGRQWLYFPEERYTEAVGVVRSAIDAMGCTDVVVHGFSNGAAFAASLYCHGESFDGRLRGVIVDDPVTDHGVDTCTPAPGVQLALYWTGGLAEQSTPGAACKPMDWTCQGDTLIGIDAYAAALGTTAQQSPNREHTPIDEPPEIATWLGLTTAG